LQSLPESIEVLFGQAPPTLRYPEHLLQVPDHGPARVGRGVLLRDSPGQRQMRFDLQAPHPLSRHVGLEVMDFAEDRLLRT